MRAEELFADISYRQEGNFDPKREISAIADRLDALDGESLFVCMRTPVRDGYTLAVPAYEKGCRLFLSERRLSLPLDAAVLLVEDVSALIGQLCDRFYRHPARGLTVIGITGSLGKSTTAQLLYQTLVTAGHRAALLMPTGSVTQSGFTPFGNLVPDMLAVWQFLHRCALEKAEVAILELSAYMLEQKVAFSIPFTAVLLTNAAPALLGEECPHKGAHMRALLSLMSSTAPFKICPVSGDIAISQGRRLTVGDGGNFSARLPEPFVGKWGYGTRFTLISPQGEARISLPLPGDYALEDALCAAALASTLGLDLCEIAQGLESLPPRGMLECLYFRMGRAIYRDAAYSPEMLARALAVLRAVTPGKLTVVVGSVGGRAKHRRMRLGAAAEQGADLVYLCADNPDAEDPAAIAADMAKGFTDPSRYVIIPDRREAILRAVAEMRPGDTLLLAGKGREDYQLVAGERVPFSESDIVRQAILDFYP